MRNVSIYTKSELLHIYYYSNASTNVPLRSTNGAIDWIACYQHVNMWYI